MKCTTCGKEWGHCAHEAEPETRFAVVEGPELTAMEALGQGLLTACQQYKALGEQLKFLVQAFEQLRKEQR